MAKQKNWILNSLLITILFPIFVYSFMATEYMDTEFIVDECSNAFDEQHVYDFFKADNYMLISGGCYNIEYLAVNDIIKLHVPLTRNVYFDLIRIDFNSIETSYSLYGYGLNWEFNNYFNAGFLANPTHNKRESDFMMNFGFNGFNTKNDLYVILENFDNNYAHKNENGRYPFPRNYTAPYIPFNTTSYFPINYLFISSGYFKNNEFYMVLKNGTGFSADYYEWSETERRDIYTHSADSSALFFRAGLKNTSNIKSVQLLNRIMFTGLIMDNTFNDSINSDAEYDRRMTIGYGIELKKGIWSFPFYGEYGFRDIDNDTNDIHRLDYLLGYGGFAVKLGNWYIQLVEIVNSYNTEITQVDSFSMIQTRLQLTVEYHFNKNAVFSVIKGFETDAVDLRHGGKYFTYDKMYMQLSINFDNFFKGKKIWTDLL